MARSIHKLTARTVATVTDPGRYGDGGGLYLVVSPTGAKKWIFRHTIAGRMTDMGLGSASETPLAKAREKAAAARSTIANGGNPVADRKNSGMVATPTFGTFADALLEQLLPDFKNAKHRSQWQSTVSVHAKMLYDVPIDQVSTDHVLSVLRPIWTEKNETAARVRGRLERILDAAKAQGLRDGENPARWRGHLSHLLTRRRKLKRGHHAALPYDDVAAFVAKLKERPAVAARALEFAILTAGRTAEVLGAERREFDLSERLWTIPAHRMKMGRLHRVPLSDRALEIVISMLESGATGTESDLVFPGQRFGKPLSQMAMAMLLRRMTDIHVTPHGFRSTFRDWAAEETDHSREVAEAALAHQVGDETERAYRRGDALSKRRLLMNDWANFCCGPPERLAQVSPMPATTGAALPAPDILRLK